MIPSQMHLAENVFYWTVV